MQWGGTDRCGAQHQGNRNQPSLTRACRYEGDAAARAGGAVWVRYANGAEAPLEGRSNAAVLGCARARARQWQRQQQQRACRQLWSR